MTQIVNIKTDEYDIYIGRGTIFGNPFEIGRDGTRDEVILKYKKWFQFLLKDNRFKLEILKLRGLRLACFCSPKPCHGDIIKEYLDHQI